MNNPFFRSSIKVVINGLVGLGILSSLAYSAPTSIAIASPPQVGWVDLQDYSAVAPAATPSAAVQAPASPLDVPDTIVNSGTVSDFTRVSTVLFWHSTGSCAVIIHAPATSQPAANPGDVLETVNRVSLIGASPDRQLYSKDLRVTNSCNPYLFSKVVADSNFLYWVDATGLVKLSRNANPGDVPQVLSAKFVDQRPYSIAIGNQSIYLSRNGYSSCGIICIFNNPLMEKVDKNTGTATGLDCQVLHGCPYGVNLKVDPGERYLYYIDTSENLNRMDLSNPTTIATLAANTTAYYPEGNRFLGCTLYICRYSDLVFIAHGLTTAGATHEILAYSNTNSNSSIIYTSNYGLAVSINDLTVDSNEIFFYEVREDTVCGGGFICYTAWLFRSGRGNAISLANIYQTANNISTSIVSSYGLDTDGTKLYWHENGNILRLSNQATALPKSPMEVTGIEVTQGVQTANNTVPLIKGKNTFVRVYVKSDDGSRDVPGIAARLSASSTGGSTGWLDPTNEFSITVKRSPSRTNLNDGYLFELPWNVINGDNLAITAELNPNHDPEQTDNYANNVKTVGPFHLNPSPRLEIRLFSYYYAMGGAVLGPAYYEPQNDIAWIQSVYPVDESSGNLETPGGGLRVNYTSIRDDTLTALIRYPTLPCEDKDTTTTPDPTKADCQDLRASAYVASQIGGMRSTFEQLYNDTDSTTYYGLIESGTELRGTPPVSVDYFPRGQDGGKNGAGPAGSDYLGFYAGHEVGHSVGMGHPATAAAGNDCGIKGSDSSPTYPNGHIGSTDLTSTMGFLDTPSYNLPRYDNSNLALGTQTMDVMAYCLPQWLSDQNYVRIYQNLTGSAPYGPAPANPAVTGNWLSIYGSITSSTSTATMDYLEHKVGDVIVPARVGGAYAIRLLDIGGKTLQTYAFTPTGDPEASLLMYGQIVPFASGTRQVRIIRLSDGHILALASISAHNPVVKNVALVNPPNPVSGTVTLSWNGSHPDGLPLKYDIFYSRDNGKTFQPLIMHTANTSEAIGTSTLGGGQAIFQVIASDGANTGSADSPVYTMVNKPPKPVITLPAKTIHIHFGQLVNFSGSAIDAQDGQLQGSGLTWTDGATGLGTGGQISVYSFNPGVHTVTLTAKNSANLTASASVTVTVDDNVEPDGPMLQIDPGTISWSINKNVTAVQSRTVTVSNFGTGSLTWQVSSDSTWLKVSVQSGNQGDSLTVTGNPAGMHDGQILKGNLTFTTSSGASPQTVKVPVALQKGNVYQSPYLGPQPKAGGPRKIYLPIVKH